MQRPNDKEIQERFDDLPQEVKSAIQSADMAAALRVVGEAHGLHLDQLGLLEDESLLVMLGFSNPAAFPERVQSSLAVDADTAAAIAAEVSERLFVPIRVSMREYMEERLKRTASGEQLAARPSQVAAGSQNTSAATSTSTPAASGGRTITPSAVQPVLHPADQALVQASITTPAITDYSVPSSGTTIQPPVPRTVDPYREPVE